MLHHAPNAIKRERERTMIEMQYGMVTHLILNHMVFISVNKISIFIETFIQKKVTADSVVI